MPFQCTEKTLDPPDARSSQCFIYLFLDIQPTRLSCIYKRWLVSFPTQLEHAFLSIFPFFFVFFVLFPLQLRPTIAPDVVFFFSFRDRNPAAGDAHRGPAIPDVITFQCERRFGVIEGAQMKPPCNKIEKKGKSLFRCRAIRRAYRGRMSKQESNFGLTFYLRNNNKKKKRENFSKKTFLISRFRKSWPSFKSNCDADSLITINSNVFQWEDKSSHL